MIAAFFGGAKSDRTTNEYLDTIKIGKILFEKGYKVKCGGYYGLMESISIGNQTTLGITCRTIGSDEGNKYLNTTIVADDIYDRLRLLIEEADLYIIQKGGLGTLAELFLTLDMLRKKKNKVKVILIGNFWRDIFNSVGVLMSDKEKDLVIIIDDISELENII